MRINYKHLDLLAMGEDLETALDEWGFWDKGWELMDETSLMSPEGHMIEWDGVSPDGEVSPFIEMGLI
jgi:hypothetical protein